MKKVKSSQATILVYNWAKHSFSLWVLLRLVRNGEIMNFITEKPRSTPDDVDIGTSRANFKNFIVFVNRTKHLDSHMAA